MYSFISVFLGMNFNGIKTWIPYFYKNLIMYSSKSIKYTTFIEKNLKRIILKFMLFFETMKYLIKFDQNFLSAKFFIKIYTSLLI